MTNFEASLRLLRMICRMYRRKNIESNILKSIIMKLNNLFGAFMLGAALLTGAQTVAAQSLSPSTKWHWDKGTIVVDTPQREAGQENVLGLTVPKMDKVRVAFVGLGMRGPGDRKSVV